MASIPASSHSVKSPGETGLSSKAAAYSSQSSTPLSPASPQSSHDSPQPSLSSSISGSLSADTAKPQIAIKPVAPNIRPIQQKVAPAGALAVNVMSMTSVVSPMPQSPACQSPASAAGKPPMSITSKEWVIPPRPKPGRKPATDTPPTKRKAQNRAAQRAFRERRAARVGELEDQLEDQKSEHEQAQKESQEKIRSLETEVQVLRSRCQMLENLLEKEKSNQAWTSSNLLARERRDSTPHLSARSDSMTRTSSAHQHIHAPVPQKPLQHSQARGSTSSLLSSSSGRRSSAQPFSISQIISPPEEDEDLTCGSCNPGGSCACAEEAIAATAALDCGKCSLGTKCVCLEESLKAFEGSSSSSTSELLKRPHPPGSPSIVAPDEKKARYDSRQGSGTEIDFTHMFSRPKQNSTRTPLPSMPPQRAQQQQQQQQPAQRVEIPLKDKCGFCSDGTYCVCADTMPGVTMTGLSTGAVIAQQKTPPPSENDAVPSPLEVTATGAIKLSSVLRRQNKPVSMPQSSMAPTRSSCGPGGPGTCAQCLSDPVSGLFCRSLAATFERQGSGSGEKAGGGCCGGGGPGGCCKNKTGAAAPGAESKEAAKPNISLSCAEAYKTLASHRHFDEATDEIGTWLPKLRAVPRHGPSSRPAERHPMEVEAASIMSVLKGFDVRFGK